ncbi:agamous-like MADS-box protein AGL29 [Nicotiana tabacum]|uniref:Agamous-like MADS-box protein AGL29 n=1 Tax=Nicotiana tabacum TaxID=4097 RepID=A0A1S3Y3F2_TOBAC|nr:agamous-like MADS-box protein AGL29 [Nicotiana tomentosiformis]XP_016446656.1 PREDICTED: agamous-like MADS-box protein AGL29 [Nicotiana tabacum]
MEGKKTRGRQSIPMKKIESEDDRYATFSKRRSGIYKKASELVKLCNIDIGIVLFSPTGKPFSFFHPTSEAIIDRFLNPNTQLSESTRLVAAHARNKVNQLNNRRELFDNIKEVTSAQSLLLDNMKENGQRYRWESIEQFNADEVKKYEAWLSTTVFNLNNRLKHLKNEASSSSSSQAYPENTDN